MPTPAHLFGRQWGRRKLTNATRCSHAQRFCSISSNWRGFSRPSFRAGSDTSFHAAFHSAVASQALRIELDTIIQQRIAIGSQQLMPTADSSADAAAVLSSEIMIDKLHSDVATRWSHMRQKEFIGNIEDALCGSANRREQSVRSSLQPSQSASLMKHSGCRKVNARKAVVNVTRLNR